MVVGIKEVVEWIDLNCIKSKSDKKRTIDIEKEKELLIKKAGEYEPNKIEANNSSKNCGK